jgi:uncharacterized C2H2 Zn-finger protein
LDLQHYPLINCLAIDNCSGDFNEDTISSDHEKADAKEEVLEELTLPVVEKIAESSTRVQEIKKQPVFKCEICDTSFNGAFELKPHIESVHGLKVAFRCGNCDVTFDTGASLTNHIKTVHEEKKPKNLLEKDKPIDFECGVCDKSFQTEKEMREHIASQHQG